MEPIPYFKLQAKNLIRDYKTQYTSVDQEIYSYSPKHFDIDEIIVVFDVDEESFSLMKAQHLIAYMAGYDKWADLLKTTGEEQELAKLVFENQNKIAIDFWQEWLPSDFDTDSKIEFFKTNVVNSDTLFTTYGNYLLAQTAKANE